MLFVTVDGTPSGVRRHLNLRFLASLTIVMIANVYITKFERLGCQARIIERLGCQARIIERLVWKTE